MPPAAVVVVGASAGGVEALRSFVAGLPADLDAAVLVVLHIPRSSPSALPGILTRSGPLPASAALDGEELRAGHIYVAPADHHLLVLDGHVRLSRGPAENGYRPAVDPLFRSAARAADSRTVAVVLSGVRDDGTAGAAAVVGRGGRLLVQSPDDALHSSMPRSAIEHVGAQRVCPAREMGGVLSEWIKESATHPPPNGSSHAQNLAALETEMANMADMTSAELPGTPSALACPSCHGGLFEIPGEPAPRYRCWVGHAWSPESLLEEQAAAFEGALWMALRSLEEKAALARRMCASARKRGHQDAAARYADVNDEAEQAAQVIRRYIARLDHLDAALPDGRRTD